MFRLMNKEGGLVGPVNVGNPNEFTMLELAEHVIRLTRSESRLVRKPLPSDDPRQRQPDISLAREALAWQPRVELEAGLTRTIEYFRELLANGWNPGND
jgi:UDP-glucuronate decarboxylase